MGAVTRAAEGLDRRAFTVSELLHMQEIGIFSGRERFELNEGDTVMMPAKEPLRGVIKSGITCRLFSDRRGRSWRRRVERGPNESLAHPSLPGFSVRLSDY